MVLRRVKHDLAAEQQIYIMTNKKTLPSYWARIAFFLNFDLFILVQFPKHCSSPASGIITVLHILQNTLINRCQGSSCSHWHSLYDAIQHLGQRFPNWGIMKSCLCPLKEHSDDSNTIRDERSVFVFISGSASLRRAWSPWRPLQGFSSRRMS